ncbi:hypothetical protein IFM89_000094, partial [Coptis chinensis]
FASSDRPWTRSKIPSGNANGSLTSAYAAQCVRYCSSVALVSNEKEVVKWVTERLLSGENTTRSFSYDIIIDHIGYKSYMATITCRLSSFLWKAVNRRSWLLVKSLF